ncbi:hypothetical protein SDRG_02326 [Saprolegnia diclina VS20]|uniref:ZZ-type domain-containing protein n=1 Tax=Saprolegnia diclina (strain VS20) TaxID=1156394 RepID=T0R2A3_SAPDV|nr:hypothetical protein SDRG_02326 [Saprolegnia diclina VS20]EQC40430.1 hypothetical protein SDRG_02326 [Saprolegnia diclina VS20]|eukprot:XP_008606129.1 hypothetical protein SDRG_02326 [Saprolegnia diclina VS20]
MEVAYDGDAVALPTDMAFLHEFILFKAHVCSEFGLATCSMSYVDGDGDVVTIANQADLDEAFAYIREARMTTLRVDVKGTKAEYEPPVAVTKGEKKATVEEAVFVLLELMHEWTIAADEDVTVALKVGFFNILLDAGFVDCWSRMAADSAGQNHTYAVALVHAICAQDMQAAEELLMQADDLGAMVSQVFHESPQTAKLLATALPALVAHFTKVPVAVPAEAMPSKSIDETLEEEKPSPASTTIHTHRICDGCGMYPLVGVRHQSLTDRNMDFCSACVVVPRYGAYAPFRSIETELPIHYNIECDGCSATPVEGIRYKSAIVDDFDLCATCEASGNWAATHEPFIKIVAPEKAQALKKAKPAPIAAVHTNIVCDGCSKHPIVGARFKSAVVKHFDLCDTCEATGAYNASHGPFLKITSVDQTPYALYVATEAAQRHDANVQPPEAFAARVEQDFYPPRRGRRGPKPHSHPFAPFAFGPPAPFVPRGHRHAPSPETARSPYLRCRFVEDVTLPDGSVVVAGQPLMKQWRLENNGDHAWPAGCLVHMVGGVGMVVDDVACSVPPLGPGEQCVLSMDLTAPQEPGRYVCYFRVCMPSGSRFGHRFWVDISVVPPPAVAATVEMVPLGEAAVAHDDVLKTKAPNTSVVDTMLKDDVAALPMATLVVHDTAEASTMDEASAIEETETSDKMEASEAIAMEASATEVVDDMADSYEYVAEAHADYVYAAQLDDLSLMGFADEETSRRLLDEYEGDLERVIEHLLQ